MLAFSSAVAGQNLIVGHSERRGRATHIITKEGVYWAAIGSVIFVLQLSVQSIDQLAPMLMPPPHAAQWAVIQKPVQFDEFFDSFFCRRRQKDCFCVKYQLGPSFLDDLRISFCCRMTIAVPEFILKILLSLRHFIFFHINQSHSCYICNFFTMLIL